VLRLEEQQQQSINADKRQLGSASLLENVDWMCNTVENCNWCNRSARVDRRRKQWCLCQHCGAVFWRANANQFFICYSTAVLWQWLA